MIKKEYWLKQGTVLYWRNIFVYSENSTIGNVLKVQLQKLQSINGKNTADDWPMATLPSRENIKPTTGWVAHNLFNRLLSADCWAPWRFGLSTLKQRWLSINVLHIIWPVVVCTSNSKLTSIWLNSADWAKILSRWTFTKSTVNYRYGWGC